MLLNMLKTYFQVIIIMVHRRLNFTNMYSKTRFKIDVDLLCFKNVKPPITFKSEIKKDVIF